MHIGPWCYEVKVAGEPLSAAGKLLNGKVCSEERVILLAPDLRGEQREETLRHEVVHCYEFHFPRPSNAEELCDLVATISKQLDDDLRAQGGWASVHSLYTVHQRGAQRHA